MAEQDSHPPVHRDFSRSPLPREPRVPRAWETLTLVHLGVLVVGLSWWFGGQSSGARQALLVWSTLGALLFFFAWGTLRQSGAAHLGPARHLWPLLILDALVIASCFNPSTRLVMHEGEQMWQHVDPRWSWLPSSARPDLSLRELWQFNGIVLSCYNAFLTLQRKRALRTLLAIVALNALALAVFGTFQKLSQAPGLWFGLVPTPQPYFFATFVYHNHWGAFTTLNLAACLALLFHTLRRGGHRDFWHSPVLLGSVAIVFIAATAPLSGSRSTTALTTLFLGGALVHFLLHTIRRRRARHESAALALVALVAAAVVAVAGILYLSRDVIRTRAAITAEQLQTIQREDTLNSRLQLYADTWRMAAEKPWFGWGLESYGDVFRIFNSQRPSELWFGQRVYREAHNDWLQALAEVGFVGTAALLLLGAAPLWRVQWRRVESSLPRYLLAGCGLLLLYAWVEFPFANPSVMVGFWLSLYVAARYARLDFILQREENEPPHA
jgi:O-antigen ligase